MKKQFLLLGLSILPSISLHPASIAPAKFQNVHERISTATQELETLLFDAKAGIIAYSSTKPTAAALTNHENQFDEQKAALETAFYELLDLLQSSEPSKNFPDNWSFDLPDYPVLEEQPAMQQEYQSLMNGFHGIINKEHFVAHFFDMWRTNDYENEVIGIFYAIGQDLIARSIDDLSAAYYNYVNRVKELHGIK